MVEHRDADLSGSRFRNVDLTGTRIHSALLHDVVTTDAWIDDVRIEGEVRSLTVNGVDVTGYVEAELARRHPELDRLRPEDVEGLRRAWAEAIARSEAVVERARRIPADRLDVQVDDEFSFIQTLRHLVMGFDRWLTGPVFGDPEPYFHPFGQPHEGADEGPEQGLDLDARPSLDEVLAVRRERQQRLTDLLATATDDDLHRTVANPNGGDTTVLHCVHVVLNEEWWHHQYATRDLAVLEQQPD
ncbi:MAG TPA: DinB family protein [Acidimicrobiales bacterium]|nr:DinB family protein [Acidimicrobiales bacterium]